MKSNFRHLIFQLAKIKILKSPLSRNAVLLSKTTVSILYSTKNKKPHALENKGFTAFFIVAPPARIELTTKS